MITKSFDIYFHLWSNGTPNWEREKRAWEIEQEKEWTYVQSKRTKKALKKKENVKRVHFAEKIVQSPNKSHLENLSFGSFSFKIDPQTPSNPVFLARLVIHPRFRSLLTVITAAFFGFRIPRLTRGGKLQISNLLNGLLLAFIALVIIADGPADPEWSAPIASGRVTSKDNADPDQKHSCDGCPRPRKQRQSPTFLGGLKNLSFQRIPRSQEAAVNRTPLTTVTPRLSIRLPFQRNRIFPTHLLLLRQL